MKMTSEQFAEVFMEGVRTSTPLNSKPNWEQTVANMAAIIYDTRKHVQTLQAMIKEMDTTASKSASFTVQCRKCSDWYELPCDLSEFNPEYSYCGKGGPSPCIP